MQEKNAKANRSTRETREGTRKGKGKTDESGKGMGGKGMGARAEEEEEVRQNEAHPTKAILDS